MLDPTTTAVCSVATAGVSCAGVALGVPVPVILAAVLGATIAVSRGERIELTLQSCWRALLTFALALAFGVFGGPLAGKGAERLLLKLFEVDLTGLGADALGALILALLGQSVILPAIAKRLGIEIESRGAGQ